MQSTELAGYAKLPEASVSFTAPSALASLAAFGAAMEALDSAMADVDEPPAILIIDESHSLRSQVRLWLDQPQHSVIEAASFAEGSAVLENRRVDLIISDSSVAGASGANFCRRLKSEPRTRLIPFMVVAQARDVASHIESIAAGADEVIFRPPHPAILQARVQSLLRNKAFVDELENADNILFGMAQAIEHRDKTTGNHCSRMAALSVELGRRLHLGKRDLRALYRGGYLHDIGKISTPDSVLNKPGALSEEEWAIMRQHTVIGEQICCQSTSLAPVLPIIRNHHERWDGSGYPDGLAGNQIPLLARVLQVADCYDALTSSRSYKPAFSHQEALSILETEARRGWRDPDVLNEFLGLFENSCPEAIFEPVPHSLSDLSMQINSM